MIRAICPAGLCWRFVLIPALLVLCVLCASAIASFADDSCPAQCDPSRLSGTVTVRDADLSIDGTRVLASGTRWIDDSIFVCWENPTKQNEKERGWVKEAVESTWQKHSSIEFQGWEKCAPNAWGVRILIADEAPHTKGAGRQLAWDEDGTEQSAGMVLNFTFANWSPACAEKKEACIRAIAVHEFAHALGFVPEGVESGSAGECAGPPSEADAAKKAAPLTPWDSCSVMNSCDLGNLRQELSPCDILLLQTVYPASE